MEDKVNTDENKLLNDLVDNIYQAIVPVIDCLKKITGQLSIAFLEAWGKTKYNMNFFEKNITRKRFYKLLQSVGYQRNEANKIVQEIHKQKGKYTILDFMQKSKEMEDQKCG